MPRKEISIKGSNHYPTSLLRDSSLVAWIGGNPNKVPPSMHRLMHADGQTGQIETA